jgi:Ulp1 family protease
VQWSQNHILQVQQSNAHDKAHYISVTQHDMDLVQPGVYVTYVIIDFWSAWIMRHEVMKESNVLPMMTYFYSSLITENGLQEVMRWFWKVDVFEKKNIFVPYMMRFIGLYVL